MITFQKIKLEDQARYRRYLSKQSYRGCEYTFANMYLWSGFYHVEAAIVEDMLVTKKESGGRFAFGFPVGEQEHLIPALRALKAYSEQRGRPFLLHMATPAQFAVLEALFPGRFQITYVRDAADYIYETEKMIRLSGKSFHAKKNHINQFKRACRDWTYETMTEENREDCFQMAMIWRNANACGEDEGKNSEMSVTMNALRLFGELHLTGGLLRTGGRVVAFSIGEPVTEDTFVVHIEKAYADVPGAYSMINQQFVEHEMQGYRYVNREEDVGEEGLRRAKLSYHPAFLEEKGIVSERAEGRSTI